MIKNSNIPFCLLPYTFCLPEGCAWAKSLLEQLQTQAKPSYLLESGAYLLDSKHEAEYRVN